MEITLKYYHYFGKHAQKLGKYLNTPHAWDILRQEDEATHKGAYFIPSDRVLWTNQALSQPNLVRQAEDIVKILPAQTRSIYSVGAGAGHLEWLIKEKNPSLMIKCSDYTPQGIERLKKVFIEAESVSTFDMLKDDWSKINADLCLLYRVDTVFDDCDWKNVLSKMNQAKITNVLFVPSEIVTLGKFIKEQVRYFVYNILNKEMTFSGYIRSHQKFVALLGEFYNIESVCSIGDLKGFLLTLKNRN